MMTQMPDRVRQPLPRELDLLADAVADIIARDLIEKQRSDNRGDNFERIPNQGRLTVQV
jgi:hypothetical protein